MQNGLYLDSCLSLGSNSSYSALADDHVYLEGGDEGSAITSSSEHVNHAPSGSGSASVNSLPEYIIELQVNPCSCSRL